LVLAVGAVFAALPPTSAYFEIDFSQSDLPEGNWQLSIISIPLYGTDTTRAEDVFNTIKSTYLDVKNLCGVPDYLEIRANPSQSEISELQSAYPIYEKAIIGKGNYGDYDNVYYFLTEEKYKECIVPSGYEKYNTLDKILKHKYKATVNFWIYHYNKGIELKKGGKDITAFYPPYCEIEDGLCTLHVTEGTQGPYFVVLEKMNSRDKIYFSEPVNINWEGLGEVKWKRFKPDTYSLNINQLELSGPNTLVVNFEAPKSPGHTFKGPKPVEPVPEPESDLTVYYLIMGLVIIVVLVVLVSISKKRIKI